MPAQRREWRSSSPAERSTILLPKPFWAGCWLSGTIVFRKTVLTREGKWSQKNRWMGSELRRKTIGLIGLGGIGGALTELLKPFQTTQLLAFDPYVASERASALNTRLTDLKELLRTSDYVIVTCPLNEQTRGLLGANELALMKPQAYLVNAARGGIVDEGALEAALKSRQIAGAAVDVFATEPATPASFLCARQYSAGAPCHRLDA